MKEYIRILQTKNNTSSITFTIPMEIVKKLNLKQGQYITVTCNEKNEIILKPNNIEKE